MGLSQEIRFKIGGDTSGLDAKFKGIPSTAERAGRAAETAFQRGIKGAGRSGTFDQRVERARKLTESERAARRPDLHKNTGPSGPDTPDSSTKRSVILGAATAALGAVASVVTRFQEALISRARAVEGTTESGLAGLRSTLSSIGGLQAQLSQGRETIGDIEARDRVDQAQIKRLSGKSDVAPALPTTLDQMTGTPGQKANAAVKNWFTNLFNSAKNPIAKAIDVVSPAALTSAMESHQKNIEAKTAQQNQNALIARELDRQLKIYEAEKAAIIEINEAQSKGIPSALDLLEIEKRKLDKLKEAEKIHGTPESERAVGLKIIGNQGQRADVERDQAKQIRLHDNERASVDRINQARREGNASEIGLAKIELERLRGLQRIENIRGSEQSKRQASLAVIKQEGELQSAQQRGRQQLLDVNQELSGQAGEGRTFRNGAQRPLSETERLARRAQQNRERARSRALTGAGGDIGGLLDSAASDEASVANRLSAATAGVRPKDVSDSTSIKPEIVRSNQLLEAIKNSLQPVDLN